MQKRTTNYQIYEKLNYLIGNKQPWTAEFNELIGQLEQNPDYPMDDPLILDLISFCLDQALTIEPSFAKKVEPLRHVLEVNYQTFDSFHYDLLATYLFDLSEHLKKAIDINAEDEIKAIKFRNMAKLFESLASICVNNAQIMHG